MDQDLKLSEVIKMVSLEKDIDRNVLIETLETAIATAAKRVYGQQREIEAHYTLKDMNDDYYNPDKDEIELFEVLHIVDEVTNRYSEITPQDVIDHQEYLVAEGDPLPMVGEEILIQIFYREDDRELAEQQNRTLGDLLEFDRAKVNFGRIAAQTAKQIILQHMRDAEQTNIYNRYVSLEGSIVQGTVRRLEHGNVIVSLDDENIDAVLPQKEQISPRESFRMGEKIEAYVKKVQRSGRDQIILSRTDANFVTKLFEKWVPEMGEGIVQILRVARQPGLRTKVAVYSSQSDVDAVGACVGVRGQRVQNVVMELRGEKIDIVPFHDDAARFVCSAISPAEVSKVFIDESKTSMEIIVPNEQLSLAIGRGGQNVRLAAQLTGWNLDIISESRLNELKNEAKRQLLAKGDIPEELIDTLFTLGYNKLEHIATVDAVELAQIPGFTAESAELIVSEAQRILEANRKAELERENKDVYINDIVEYLDITERQAKLIYNGGYHNLAMLFVEGDAHRLDARTAIGENLAASVIKNLEELAVRQEVYTQEELDKARAAFNSVFAEKELVSIDEAYDKVVKEFGEKVFPIPEDDDIVDDEGEEPEEDDEV